MLVSRFALELTSLLHKLSKERKKPLPLPEISLLPLIILKENIVQFIFKYGICDTDQKTIILKDNHSVIKEGLWGSNIIWSFYGFGKKVEEEIIL